jgi:hypothetical protein
MMWHGVRNGDPVHRIAVSNFSFSVSTSLWSSLLAGLARQALRSFPFSFSLNRIRQARPARHYEHVEFETVSRSRFNITGVRRPLRPPARRAQRRSISFFILPLNCSCVVPVLCESASFEEQSGKLRESCGGEAEPTWRIFLLFRCSVTIDYRCDNEKILIMGVILVSLHS